MREIKFKLKKNWTMPYKLSFVEGDTLGLPPEYFVQYTGLKDKNGIEIYEGDIVRRKSSDGVIEIVPVEYHAPRFNIGDYVEKYGYTIIGNIYENPELLKEGVIHE